MEKHVTIDVTIFTFLHLFYCNAATNNTLFTILLPHHNFHHQHNVSWVVQQSPACYYNQTALVLPQTEQCHSIH